MEDVCSSSTGSRGGGQAIRRSRNTTVAGSTAIVKDRQVTGGLMEFERTGGSSRPAGAHVAMSMG